MSLLKTPTSVVKPSSLSPLNPQLTLVKLEQRYTPKHGKFGLQQD